MLFSRKKYLTHQVPFTALERKSIQSLKKLIPQDISFRNDYYFNHGLLNLDLLIFERKKRGAKFMIPSLETRNRSQQFCNDSRILDRYTKVIYILVLSEIFRNKDYKNKSKLKFYN